MKKHNYLLNKVWSFLFDTHSEQKPDSETEKVIRRLDTLSRMGSFNEEKTWTRLQNKTTKFKKAKHSLTHRNIIPYAAAIAAIVIISSVLFLNKQNQHNTDKTEWAILADNDSRNIRLTLEGGETLVLPEKNNVIVTEDNSLIVQEQEAATLSYNTEAGTTPEEIEYNTLEIPVTKNYRLELSDGSVVHLNSDTRIRFPNRFASNERRIFLEKGEAYFEVSENKKSPFIVEVRNTRISVLGTAFNISAYTENTQTVTTLVQGSVKVQAQEKEIMLRPGQQTIDESNSLLVRQVDAYQYAAWKDGLFIFKNQPLESVMRQIYRWYGCSIFFTSQNLKEIALTGVIRKNQPLEEIFDILKKTAKIDIEIENENNIKILPRQ
ncbi:MAG: FecR domain-containing protein [Bacteroidia bacterium]|nr:FecR domain-containing protein [Bacteroidia bacterium]